MGYIRVTLLPATTNVNYQYMDIPDTDLVFSQGEFTPVQLAQTVTLVGVPVEYSITPFDSLAEARAVTTQQTQEIKVVYREPVSTSEYPDTDAIVKPDPTGGAGVYGITLNETRISFAKVTQVTS